MRGLFKTFAPWALLFVCVALPARAVSAGPRPASLQTYKDWTIGCDNGGRCEAVSLLPPTADFSTSSITLGVVREQGPDAQVEVWLRHADDQLGGTVGFYVDGRKVGTARVVSDEARVRGPQASALAVTAAHGTMMEIKQGDRTVGRLSLAGSAAALRYMDARQGRAGTTTALIASGNLDIPALREAPVLPEIRRAIVPPGLKSVALWREELIRAGKQSGCSREVDGTREAEEYPLSKAQTLVLIPCGAGAYNFSSVPMIATGVVGRRTFTPARFDFQPGWSEDPAMPMLVNASWDVKLSQLSSFAKGRGVGDCGGSEAYIWDGTMFRLVEAKAMGECRGAWHWITTWRAKVIN
ncbi:DUF1176 domain-containing protein [soil metagenome]